MAQVKQGRWVTPASEGVSSALRLGSDTLVGFYTPSALDAQALKLQASHDGQAFFDVVEGGAAWAVAGEPNAYIPLDAAKLLGAVHVRVQHLDGQGAPVAETAERSLLPVFRSFE